SSQSYSSSELIGKLVNLFDRYHLLTQHSLDSHYRGIQEFAFSGDVSKLLEPLLPMFYLHNHTHRDTLLHSVIVKDNITAFNAMMHTLRKDNVHTSTIINMVNAYYETPLHVAV
ncbi:hypothetical protein, partial [Salmonella sp. s54836]|uniref:hypothetical protein n=1 Tax=Salmonella sp. s54836 TaxID=3159673 RepID=UPI003980D1DC